MVWWSHHPERQRYEHRPGSGRYGEISPELARQIDDEVRRIMNEGYARTKEVLTVHRKVLDAIAEKLVEVETLEQPEYEEILKAHGIALKKLEEGEKPIDITG